MRTPGIANKDKRSADQDRNNYIAHTEVRIHASPDQVWGSAGEPGDHPTLYVWRPGYIGLD
jgi:hypothetical protein